MCIVFFAALGFGCTTVSHANLQSQEGEGKYRVSINKAYLTTQESFRYAINSFVIERGGTSFDVERDYISGRSASYIVTIPGNTPVDENLPTEKILSKKRTHALIWPIVGPILFGGIMFFAFGLPLLL
ncbi:MAG: hypothetical protein FWC24_03020 [Treponema sp.]|nr:hypothetical protein [Treponema sp.]MCL2270295.1 hypothetical protein [Treponema sp.]